MAVDPLDQAHDRPAQGSGLPVVSQSRLRQVERQRADARRLLPAAGAGVGDSAAVHGDGHARTVRRAGARSRAAGSPARRVRCGWRLRARWCMIDEVHRRKLRDLGLLTRDARTVERKKPGRPKARKRFQFSKR